jgi:hypothetical protein
MKIADRMVLLDRLGRTLQERYTFNEIDLVLRAARLNGLQPSDRRDSKWVYSKERLASVEDAELIRLAKELDLPVESGSNQGVSLADLELAQKFGEPPDAWRDCDDFRLFVSHISTHKKRAHRLKEALAPYGVAAFVAHDDIRPTKQWREEILKALNTMDGFVAVLTEGFSQSVWCNQEVGFAIAMRAKIISFKMEEDPPGFLGDAQALPWRRGKMAEDIAREIYELLSSDPSTKLRLRQVPA